MIDTLIVYWQPGSGGDTLHKILYLHPQFISVVDSFSLTEDGRNSPKIDPWFLDNFDHTPGEWLWRQWTYIDLDRLKFRWPTQTHQTLVVPTHRYDQARWLQTNLSNSRIIGICYPKELYFAVLQSWVRKVGCYDKGIKDIYQDQWSSDWGSGWAFRLFKDQIRFGSVIAQQAPAEWDINLNYGDLLIGCLDSLRCLDVDHSISDKVLAPWLLHQKKLYQHQWPVSDSLRAALGVNYQAPISDSYSIELDVYDKILLQNWCEARHIKTTFSQWQSLEQAELFFCQPGYCDA